MYRDLKWTESEKKVARRAFEAALEAELAQVVSQFKTKSAAATTPDHLWDIETWLRDRRREIDDKYDYRYSVLVLVFGRLLREGRIREEQLVGLSPEKLSFIQGIASLS